MSDLRPMWEKICRDLGIDAQLVDVHFLFRKEARYEYGVEGLGAVNYQKPGRPEIVVVFPKKGKTGHWRAIGFFSKFGNALKALVEEQISNKGVK